MCFGVPRLRVCPVVPWITVSAGAALETLNAQSLVFLGVNECSYRPGAGTCYVDCIDWSPWGTMHVLPKQELSGDGMEKDYYIRASLVGNRGGGQGSSSRVHRFKEAPPRMMAMALFHDRFVNLKR